MDSELSFGRVVVRLGAATRRERKALVSCSLPLVAQLEGRDRATVRLGEHPRDRVHRLDLLDDRALDAFRGEYPGPSAEAMDAALDVDEALERLLEAKGLDVRRLETLPERPILAVFVCLQCGSYAAARTVRDWRVDRAMRGSSLGERDVLAVMELLGEAFGSDAPTVDRFDGAALTELRSLVDEDVDVVALRERVAQILRSMR